MSTQIAVRLSDDTVAFIDDLVAKGEARSRAAVVEAAVERERRRKIAEHDVEILKRVGGDPYPDLAGVVTWAARRPLDDLD